ncbi:MAG TPA: glycoside hydrolase family 2 TIM barrel-domain containing protein, partial [Candidatus Saccharimonadales bacterium]|nr:glycoside hydrolase family 2 TIM barrel-domain containing protein [Candidatus Saccharimonadales bacterium]
NMNAVRMSHYPPDADFLDECDRGGIYVLDELAGWHHAYDTPTGTKLVGEMVPRDVNHPCILFWDNGNEGGFNTNLDKLFDQYDPQHRRVLHPWAPFDGLNTAHYLPYDFVKLACAGVPITFHRNNYFANTNSPQKYIYMPTEFIHGLFDGGAGSGLADVWALMQQSPYIGGGFIWAFLDEGVQRPDNGQIDVDGNQAPDGIVGPYRQREASFYAIKQIWSPIVILETNLPANFDGTLTVQNHFSFTDTRQCKFTWQLRHVILPRPLGGEGGSGENSSQRQSEGDPAVSFAPTGGEDVAAIVQQKQVQCMNTNDETVLAEGSAKSPSIPPGGCGQLHLKLPKHLMAKATAEGDLLALRITDPTGRELYTYVWPLGQPPALGDNSPIIARTDYSGAPTGTVELKGNDIVAQIKDGELVSVERDGRTFSLNDGPRVAATNSIIKSISWTLRADGRLQCDYTYSATGTNDFFGVVFDYPENLVKSKRWFGDGPYRVWKNRRQGVTQGLWQNGYNDTITGWHDWVYPEFKGCFADVHWMQLETAEGEITVVPDHVPFMQVLNPKFPPADIAGHTIPPLPSCGLGFLDNIPPMGSKFQAANVVSPSGERAVASGDYSGSISFYFAK